MLLSLLCFITLPTASQCFLKAISQLTNNPLVFNNPMVLYARKNFPNRKVSGKSTGSKERNYKSNFKEAPPFSATPKNQNDMLKSETKARDLKNALKRPFVERIVRPGDRLPLSSFSEGQKVSGRIISITEYV
jgi:hypothetical protein